MGPQLTGTYMTSRAVARALLAALFVLTVSRPAAAAISTSGTAPIAQIPVSFDVLNINRSAVPCPTDGLPYTVTGHLVGPRSEFTGPQQRPRLVTVLLTGLDEGEWTWRFQAVPGYDYPLEMARLGDVSLSVDMLGYGASGHPNGHLLCFGSQADVLHQIIGQLRRGSYHVPDGEVAVPFSTVVASARDSGVYPAVEDAYSWPGDVDGLSGQLAAHQGFTDYVLGIFARRAVGCSLGGQNWNDPKDNPDDLTDDPSHGGGYIYFGPADEEFQRNFFDSKRADPAVIDAVLRLRNRNPCGYVSSIVSAINTDLQRMSEIKVPVLLVFPGPADHDISRQGQEQEAANYSGSDDVTSAWLDSGHFPELEGCAASFRALYQRWMHQRWHAGADVPAPAVGPDQCVTEVSTA
jgi:hypothetical protein